MRFIKAANRRLGISGELLSFFMANKRSWLLPIIVVLLMFGVFIILAQSSAISAFLYSLF